ncbi:MAG TPA: hypothetical protein PKV70_05540 [Thermodesulfobacteriota bacterium]|nr:hypothetical protein [Thermodesulfobacteriota bacterium]
MSNPFAGAFSGTMNPFKKSFWTNNAMMSGSNLLTGGGRGLAGSGFKGGGGNPLDESIKPLTPGAKGDIEALDKTAKSDAEAAVKQAEFEASKREGLERLALKRKRGFAASQIVTPTLGSISTLGS